MPTIDSHQMELVRTYPGEAEEWFCPTCGRRFLLYWPPNYARQILVQGDASAAHSGGKDGVRPNPPKVNPD